MEGISVERHSQGGGYLVRGPYEPDYGRPHYGNVARVENGFSALGTDGSPLGVFRRKREAVDAVVTWARDNLTAESVLRDFEPVTEGGVRVEFRRRVMLSGGASIVAEFTDRRRGVRVQAAWNGDGSYGKHGTVDVEELLERNAMRLVRRKPESDPDPEAVSPRP